MTIHNNPNDLYFHLYFNICYTMLIWFHIFHYIIPNLRYCTARSCMKRSRNDMENTMQWSIYHKFETGLTWSNISKMCINTSYYCFSKSNKYYNKSGSIKKKVRPVIYEVWHFIHMRKALALQNYVTKRSGCGP
jgi:hypothetical protein